MDQNQQKAIYTRLSENVIGSTEIRNVAKDMGRDHDFGLLLWKDGQLNHRMLAVLILDIKQLDPATVDRMIVDLERFPVSEQVRLSDWLIANLIMKKEKLVPDLRDWYKAESMVKQRIGWSYHARTLGKGKVDEGRNQALLEVLENKLASADPLVQDIMNWCAAQIGICDEKLRDRCIDL